ERLETKDVLLYLAERFLRTDPEGTPEGRQEREESPYVLVYQQCPGCRQAWLRTADGPVEVKPARVERLVGDAAEVALEEDAKDPAADAAATAAAGIPAAAEPAQSGASPEAATTPTDPAPPAIDRPNPPALARRVKLRDGMRCQNPGCRQRGPLHAHHIEPRAEGGRTVAANEAATCTTCHALIHAGLLEVTGDPRSGLTWRPRSAGLAVDPAVDRAALAAVPTVRLESVITDSSSPAVPAMSEDDVEALAGALVRLGLGKKQARARIQCAVDVLVARGAPLDDGKVLSLALSGA
ncbi:MAG: HNH endonuclease, partial [Planctomycetes bacterium]|nr:HNH endonuclease [Planctomycetota bacterium]